MQHHKQKAFISNIIHFNYGTKFIEGINLNNFHSGSILFILYHVIFPSVIGFQILLDNYLLLFLFLTTGYLIQFKKILLVASVEIITHKTTFSRSDSYGFD